MRCLRCGAKTEENRSFCDGCAERVRDPLEDSPYLHTQIVLPTRRARPVPKRPEPKKEQKKRPWGWILWTVLLGMLCIALLLQGSWYFASQLKTQASLRQAETERAALEQELQSLKEAVSELELENAAFEKEVAALQGELSAAQIDMVDLMQKIQTLSQQIVFVEETDDSNRFHRQGCVKFDARDFRAFVRDDAVRKGYEPCELCLP